MTPAERCIPRLILDVKGWSCNGEGIWETGMDSTLILLDDKSDKGLTQK